MRWCWLIQVQRSKTVIEHGEQIKGQLLQVPEAPGACVEEAGCGCGQAAVG